MSKLEFGRGFPAEGSGILAVNPLIIKSFFETELVQIVLNSGGIFEGWRTEIDAVFADIESIAGTPKVNS
jgi:hypothetical protein